MGQCIFVGVAMAVDISGLLDIVVCLRMGVAQQKQPMYKLTMAHDLTRDELVDRLLSVRNTL